MMVRLSPPIVAGALRGATLFFRFVLMFFLARSASLEVVGLFGLYWAALQLATTLLPLDVYAQTSRFILKKGAKKKEIVSKHLGFVILVFILFGPLSAVLFGFSSESIGRYLLVFFFFHLLFEIISSETGRLLVPLGKPLAANVILFLRSASWVPALIIGLEAGLISPKLDSIILFWLLGSMIACIASVVFLAKFVIGPFLPKIDWRWCRETVWMGVFFLASTLIFRGILGLDRFIIEDIFGIEAVAVYALFASVSLGILGLVESGVSAWHFPKLVKAIQSRDFIMMEMTLKTFSAQNFIASIILMGAVTLFFSGATHFFLDEIYVKNLDVFYVIAFSVLVYCLSMPYHYVIYGFKKDSYLFGIYAVSLVVMLIWAYLFMGDFGLLGGGVMLALALGLIASLRLAVAKFLIRRFIATS